MLRLEQQLMKNILKKNVEIEIEIMMTEEKENMMKDMKIITENVMVEGANHLDG